MQTERWREEYVFFRPAGSCLWVPLALGKADMKALWLNAEEHGSVE
jgi:hypothetical protein